MKCMPGARGIQVWVGSLAGCLGCGCLQLLVGPALGAHQVQHAKAGVTACPHGRAWSDRLQADKAHIVAVLIAGDEILQPNHPLLVVLIGFPEPLLVCRANSRESWHVAGAMWLNDAAFEEHFDSRVTRSL